MSESELRTIERAAIEAMAVSNSAFLVAIRKQGLSAKVNRRKNTGCGFMTELEVDKNIWKIDLSVINNVYANISGLENPFIFVLFIKNGFMVMLEGASVGEGTSKIDFSNIEFEVFSMAKL